MIGSKFLGSSEASVMYGIADCVGDWKQPWPSSLATEVRARGSEESCTLLYCPTYVLPTYAHVYTQQGHLLISHCHIQALAPGFSYPYMPVSDLNKSHYELQNEENATLP